VDRDPRGRTAWVVPLLLCAAILLIAALAFNLAYLDTGGEQLPASPGGGAANPGAAGILDSRTASTLVLIGFLAFVVSAFILFVLQRRQGIPVKRVLRPSSWMDVVAALVAFGIFGALLVVWPRLVEAVQPHGTQNANLTNASGNVSVVPSVAGIPLGYFLIAAVVASVIAIALFFRVGSSLLHTAPPFSRLPRREAAKAVQAALDELQVGGDVRETILGCYARFCVLLGAKGILDQETLTPRELEDLAVRQLAVSEESSDALTGLFEEARYSEHPLGDADRDRAVASLKRIRSDLEA
jgi:uncharacterized protein DUF4129